VANFVAVLGNRRKQTKRFQHAQAVMDRVHVAYPPTRITVVGRSLGGTLA
jgi:putative lipase involved disintegration of autophagic bodies